MSLQTDVQRLTHLVERQSDKLDQVVALQNRHEEQISGESGIIAQLKANKQELRSNKLALWTLVSGIALSAIGAVFALVGGVG